MSMPHNQIDTIVLFDPPLLDQPSMLDQPAMAEPIPSTTSDRSRTDSRSEPTPPREAKSGFRQHPVIFLTGIWLVLMVLGWLSMAEIISPGAKAPLPKTPIATVQREKNSSLGVLGAIAASCAVVSVLLAQKMERR
jgi:hypothetical protein